MDRHPSETSPSFTTERLQLLARTIEAVRRDALDGHEPEKGDNAWTFGCRAYSRTCFAFSGLADSGDHPWLEVDLKGLACTLLLDGEALNFYRGDADRPSARSLRRGIDEAIRQGKLAFFEDELRRSTDEWFWLMAIETHDDGTVMRVAVFQADRTGETRNLWFVPMDGDVAVAASLTPMEREGVDLLPPDVSPRAVSEDVVRPAADGTKDGSE